MFCESLPQMGDSFSSVPLADLYQKQTLLNWPPEYVKSYKNALIANESTLERQRISPHASPVAPPPWPATVLEQAPGLGVPLTQRTPLHAVSPVAPPPGPATSAPYSPLQPTPTLVLGASLDPSQLGQTPGEGPSAHGCGERVAAGKGSAEGSGGWGSAGRGSGGGSMLESGMQAPAGEGSGGGSGGRPGGCSWGASCPGEGAEKGEEEEEARAVSGTLFELEICREIRGYDAALYFNCLGNVANVFLHTMSHPLDHCITAQYWYVNIFSIKCSLSLSW